MFQTNRTPCRRSFQTITKASRPCIIRGVYKTFQVLTSLLTINNRNVKTRLFHVVSPISQFLYFTPITPCSQERLSVYRNPFWTGVIKCSIMKRMHCGFLGLSRTLHEALNLKQWFYAIYFKKISYFIDP